MSAKKSGRGAGRGPRGPRSDGRGEDGRAGYAIGTVAGLTGLDPHTIRAWERRHRAVSPVRSAGGSRRYGARDVARLQLLKALVDAGEAIGGVARLDDGALRERLVRLSGMAAAKPAAPASAPVAVALLAPALAGQLAVGAAALGRFRVTLSCVDHKDLLARLAAARAHVVVAELPALGPEPLAALRRIRRVSEAGLVIVLYDFAPAPELARLAREGARLVRGPLRLGALRQTIEDLLALQATAPRRAVLPTRETASVPSRRFDEAQLATLRETIGAVQCECPSHLASLVSSLAAFERYSRTCEDRDEEDAALHRRLVASSSRIRGELEDLLASVCRHEGIRL